MYKSCNLAWNMSWYAILMDSSEEFGNTTDLGFTFKSYPNTRDIAGESLIVPHIGWNALETSFNKSWDNTLLANTPLKSNVYFVHSFFSKPNDDNHLLAHCIYGGNDLSAVISKDNVMGCQFHPEKSGEIGLNILKTFLSI